MLVDLQISLKSFYVVFPALLRLGRRINGRCFSVDYHAITKKFGFCGLQGKMQLGNNVLSQGKTTICLENLMIQNGCRHLQHLNYNTNFCTNPMNINGMSVTLMFEDGECFWSKRQTQNNTVPKFHCHFVMLYTLHFSCFFCVFYLFRNVDDSAHIDQLGGRVLHSLMHFVGLRWMS